MSNSAVDVARLEPAGAVLDVVDRRSSRVTCGRACSTRGRGLKRSCPKFRRMSARRTKPTSGLKLSPTVEALELHAVPVAGSRTGRGS